MKNVLSHLFLPQESNNHRAKVLHHNSLSLLVIGIFVFQLLFVHIEQKHPEVLGTSTDISAQKLLELANKERIENGLSPININSELTTAAENKAQDMFKSNYWAHFSPIGTTPWDFIKGAGYDYVYAGENLARGFTTSEDVMNAWMNSPSHRENQLSPNYKDVGFAVEDGTLLGEQTTLVVEEFGSTTETTGQNSTPSPSPIIQNPSVNSAQQGSRQAVQAQPTSSPDVLAASLRASTIINGAIASKGFSGLIFIFFIVLLIIDAIFIERKKISRLLGNHIDHIIYFAILLGFVILFTHGEIL